MTRFAVLNLTAAVTIVTAIIVPARQVHAEGYCKAGHHYDEAKGLCYDPGIAYQPDVPQGASATGGLLPNLSGAASGIMGRAAFCQYGDRLRGSGDQAYCVSKTTGKPYPAGR